MLELTIQRRMGNAWPVVAERHLQGALLPVRYEGHLDINAEPDGADARSYGTALGKALFRDTIRDALAQARGEETGGARVLLFVEDEELKAWRWEWLCAPVAAGGWDFLALDQRLLFSLYLPSLADQMFPPIGARDLRVLVLVANPADPQGHYGLTPFDATMHVTRLKDVFGPLSFRLLARLPEAVAPPTLDALVTELTQGTADGPHTILHVVCHGWTNPQGETVLYLEQADLDANSGEAMAAPVNATDLIARLQLLERLPHLVFLSVCDSASPEAEKRLGGLAQRLVRKLGIPAVIGMTERVTVATAYALAEQFYARLLADQRSGEVDRALAQAYAGLAARPDVNVPALYGRLGERPLFSTALDRALTAAEIGSGLQMLDIELVSRAPVLRPFLAQLAKGLQATLPMEAPALAPGARLERDNLLTEINVLCQEVVEINFNALARSEPLAAYDARQPFRGLAPFRGDDRKFFFGRDALVGKLRRRLDENSFLAVLGSSGSGKSSVVLAGLAPTLATEFPGLQVVDDLTPGTAPLDQLAVRKAKLHHGPVLWIIDQFEELFTLTRDEVQRTQFIAAVLDLANHDRVVITMRADFWGECARYTAFKERMQACQELIAPMNSSELRTAIEQQTGMVGLRFEADLANTVLDDVTGEPAAMPLLQHALLELWRRRHGRWLRAAEYRALGGVKETIARTADGIFAGLPPSNQDRMRDIFLRLTQLDQTATNGETRRDTRRRLPLSDLVPAGGDAAGVKLLVKQLADAALLVTSRNELTKEDEVEVAHEALIRQWKRLRDWLDGDLVDLRLRDSINEAAKEWEKDKKDEALLIHRGARLEEAQRLRQTGPLSWTEDEIDYLDHCVRRDHKETTRKKAIIASFALLGLVILAVVSVFWRSAARDSELAFARQLAARSQLLVSQRGDLLRPALQLAVQSVHRLQSYNVPDAEAEGALRLALALSPRRLGEFHQAFGYGGRTQFDPKTGNVLVVGVNGVATLRTREGRLLRTFAFGHLLARSAIDRDGRYVVAVAARGKDIFQLPGNQVLLLDTSTGEIRSQFADRPISDLAIDAKNNRIAVVTEGAHIELLTCDGLAKIDKRQISDVKQEMRHFGNMQFSPTGNELLVSASTAEKDSTNNLYILAVPSMTELGRLDHKDIVRSVALSPDGGSLASVSRDGAIRVATMRGKLLYKVLPESENPDLQAVSFSHDGKHLAVGGHDYNLWILDAKSGSIRHQMRHGGSIRSVVFSHTSDEVAAVSEDRTVRIWNAHSGREIQRMVVDGKPVSFAFSKDDETAIGVTAEGEAVTWVTTRAPSLFATGHEQRTWSYIGNVGRRQLLGSDTRVEVLNDAADAQEQLKLRNDFPVSRYALSPKKTHLALASTSAVTLWDITGIKPKSEGALQLPKQDPISILYFSDSGANLVIGQSHDGLGSLSIFSVSDKRIVGSMAERPTRDFRISKSGNFISTTRQADMSPRMGPRRTFETILTVYDTSKLRDAVEVRTNGDNPSVAISNAGVLFYCTSDGDVRIARGSRIEETSLHLPPGHRCSDVRLFEDEDMLAVVASADQDRILAFDLKSNLKVADLAATRGFHIGSADFDRRSQRMINLDGKNSVDIFDLRSGKLAASVAETGSMESARFSADGRFIVTTTRDGIVTVWEMENFQSIVRFKIAESGGWNRISASFTEGDQFIQTVVHRSTPAGYDSTVRQWLWRPKDLIHEGCQRAGKMLTTEEWRSFAGKREWQPACQSP